MSYIEGELKALAVQNEANGSVGTWGKYGQQSGG